MRITNVEKKKLANVFISLKINISDFHAIGEYEEFKIKYKFDYFSFAIVKQKPDVFLVEYFSVDNKEGASKTVNWNDLTKLFLIWSQKLADELNSATGWETFENTNYLNIDYDELNSEFNEVEKIQIKENITNIKVKLTLLNLPPDKLEIIEHKLDSLSLKVDELNKFDWKSLFAGTIMSLIMTFIVPPEAAGIFLEYIKVSFYNLKIGAK